MSPRRRAALLWLALPAMILLGGGGGYLAADAWTATAPVTASAAGHDHGATIDGHAAHDDAQATLGENHAGHDAGTQNSAPPAAVAAPSPSVAGHATDNHGAADGHSDGHGTATPSNAPAPSPAVADQHDGHGASTDPTASQTGALSGGHDAGTSGSTANHTDSGSHGSAGTHTDTGGGHAAGTPTERPRAAVLTVFAAVNLTILLAAAVLRRRGRARGRNGRTRVATAARTA